ncbi:hypothetical protein ACL02R_17125 [Streptomyces sp. MS19]|uniref:hypothetical protein n=1 Tax=Streptomyces sp. MS19 TaxID=3385972 RepID=UPI0039A1C012
MSRRSRADRKPREIQRAAADTPATNPVAPDYPPADLRTPSLDPEITGLVMRWDTPLVINSDIRACPQCGSYRNWVVISMRDGVWLRCPAGHETPEPALDAAWFNQNSGPADRYHATLDDALRHLDR